MMHLDNEYIRALGEAEPWSVVECCANCHEDLYVGQEVVKDEDDNYFCDSCCAEDFHGIEEIIL